MVLIVSLLSGVLVSTFVEGTGTCLDKGPWINTALGVVGGLFGAFFLKWAGLAELHVPASVSDGLPIQHLGVFAVAGALGACLVLALCCACRGFTSK